VKVSVPVSSLQVGIGFMPEIYMDKVSAMDGVIRVYGADMTSFSVVNLDTISRIDLGTHRGARCCR